MTMTLDNTAAPELGVKTTETCDSHFTEFSKVSEDTVLNMINGTASTTCT